MPRTTDAAFLAELAQASNQPCYLVEAHFDSGTVYMTDAWRSVVWGGNTYNANGHFLKFDGLNESLDLQIPTVTVRVSGVDQEWVGIVLAEDYLGRGLVIRKGFIDYAAGVISSPLLLFEGSMDAMAIEDDPGDDQSAGSTSIAVTAVNVWADFARRAGRHTNDAEQQAKYPGDRFFDANTDYNRQMKWGSA